jgi:hypothetical protein
VLTREQSPISLEEDYEEAFSTYSSLEISLVVIAPAAVLQTVRNLDLAIIEYKKIRFGNQRDVGWKQRREKMQSALIDLAEVMRKDTLESPSVDRALIEEFLGHPPT